MGHVEVEARAAQARVSKQQLDTAQVDTGFEQMRRKRVPLMPSSALAALCRAPSYAG